jgi:sugar diacid utilization regulator
VVIDIDAFEQYCLLNAHKGEKHFQDIKNRLNRTIKTALTLLNDKGKIVSVSDCFAAFLEISPKLSNRVLESKLHAIADYIQQESKKKLEGLNITIGVGKVVPSLLDLSKSYTEAKEAIEIGRKVYGNSNTYFYEQMGIYSLLWAQNIDKLKENYLSAWTNLSQNEKLNDTVLDTLETYFDCNESVSATAKLLDIHPNTVKYRLNKAVEAFGEDFDMSSAEKLKIHVILKMRKLL